MRAAGYTALLWIGVSLLPASGSIAGVPEIQQLVSRAENEGFTDPELLNRDALAALEALRSTADADLEIRPGCCCATTTRSVI